jgi:hypothetical protein
MTPPSQSRRWRLCRGFLRGMRTGALFALFILIAGAFYLNQIGLPGFLKRPLLARLHERGVDLQFSRLRLRWRRGVVAENVRFGQAGEPLGPQLSLKEVQLKLDHAALKKFRLNVDALILRDGRLTWPLGETNNPGRELSADGIQANLRLLAGDEWRLEDFQAGFAGVKLQLSGALTNASLVRNWKFFQAPEHAPSAASIQERLRRLADTLDEIRFPSPPELKVILHGDARDWRSFHGFFSLSAPGASTPWGTLTNGLLLARLAAPNDESRQPRMDMELHADAALTRWGATTNFQLGIHSAGTNRATIELRADAAQTRWGGLKKLRLNIHATSLEQTNLLLCGLDLSAGEFDARWTRATNAQVTAQWTHSLTNLIPLDGTAVALLKNARTPWGGIESVRLDARMAAPATNLVSQANESWAWWADLEPFFLDWNCQLDGLQSTNVQVASLICGGHWRAPDLVITNLHSDLYDGSFDARGAVNVATREAAFEATSSFDAQQVMPLFTERTRHWFQQYSWEKPPLAHAQGGVTLPAWTNSQPDWRDEVLPTLWLQGDFKAGRAAYRGVPLLSAQSHFAYSNMFWNLPDLAATRPEGKIELVHTADDRTRNYYFRVHSAIDPRALRPLLETNGQRALDYIELSAPPVVDAEIWGRWHEQNLTRIRARIDLTTNFSFRGESATGFHTALEYTNRFVTLTDARLDRGPEFLSASSVGLDFAGRTVQITNGYSATDPAAVTRAIGPKVAKAMEPYQFLQPPKVRVNGIFPMDNSARPDAHFDVDGGPFHWAKFNLSRISGQAHWVGEHLTLQGVQAAFYQGKLTGQAAFDFSPTNGTDFNFDTAAADASLHLLIADVFAPTNNLEGLLTGRLSVTNANSRDPRSWFGHGEVDLRDGFIWDIPIFGIFSPVLDSIIPGLGKSRASQASAAFIITNGVVRSDDLQIIAPALRIQYKGTVDFAGKVDARMTAEPLPNTWMVGMMLWPVSKLFEYKVTGTLAQPKQEQVFFISRLLLAPFQLPFHPFRTLKGLVSGGESGSSTSTNSVAPLKPNP